METTSVLATPELEEGQVRYCKYCGMPCRDEDLLLCLGCGSLYCGQGMCRAICPCHQLGSVFIPNRPAEKLFARLVQENPVAVIIKDAGGRVIHVTDPRCILVRTLGVSTAELIGMTNCDLFSPSQSTLLDRVEAEVTSRLRPFRFAIGLTVTSGLFHRFMMEIAPYRMAQGDHLTITTLTPASGQTTRNRPEEHCSLYALQT